MLYFTDHSHAHTFTIHTPPLDIFIIIICDIHVNRRSTSLEFCSLHSRYGA